MHMQLTPPYLYQGSSLLGRGHYSKSAFEVLYSFTFLEKFIWCHIQKCPTTKSRLMISLYPNTGPEHLYHQKFSSCIRMESPLPFIKPYSGIPPSPTTLLFLLPRQGFPLSPFFPPLFPPPPFRTQNAPQGEDAVRIYGALVQGVSRPKE